MSTHYDAARAARYLGVSRATLYSYVSRGLVRSRPVGGAEGSDVGGAGKGRRAHEYAREDIERLAAQTRGRKDPLGVARHALAIEGLPVLHSALCLIDGGRLYYRGRDAIELSREARFEDVARLLWDGPCPVPQAVTPPSAPLRRSLARLGFAAAALAHLARLESGHDNRGAHALDAVAVRVAGGRILAELVALAAGFAPLGGSIAERLASAFGTRGPRARRALEAALIVCADHELNASAFAARVIAAAGATPSMAVMGALAALSGHRHGGAAAQVVQLFEHDAPPAESVARHLAGVSGVTSTSAALAPPGAEPAPPPARPGFGHALYPAGDPRAQRLLELCLKNRELRRAEALAAAAERSHGMRPNLDFGLVALCRSFGWPPQAPFILFAIGRSVGWVGHCLEQYADGVLIRPRARYVGVPPEPAPRRRP